LLPSLHSIATPAASAGFKLMVSQFRPPLLPLLPLLPHPPAIIEASGHCRSDTNCHLHERKFSK
jgi:hypothetical protein